MPDDKKFQSLLGFLMRCDRVKCLRFMQQKVSIPAGFSDALRHSIRRYCKSASGTVSIPAGFSDALRPCTKMPDSLQYIVSIPAGFSDALRLLGQFLVKRRFT